MSWKSTSTTNPALLLRAQIPRRNIGQIAHVSTTPSITSQEADITRRAPEVACWLRLGCWSNNSANSRSSAGVFRRVLCSCLVPQSSHLCDGARIVTWEITYKWKIDFLAKYITTGEYIYNHARWTLLLLVILSRMTSGLPPWGVPASPVLLTFSIPTDEHAINNAWRIATGCLRPTPADNLPIIADIQSAEFRRNRAAPSLTSPARCAMEPGHLVHSALTRSSSAEARRLKSKHPFLPAAQQLIRSSDNNTISAAHWADHQ